jgi:amino acid transporter
VSFFWSQATSPLWRALIIVLVVAVLAVINLLGIRQAAIVSNVFTVGKLVPIILFIAAGLFFVKPSSYAFGPTPATGAFSQSVLLLVYAFTGFEMATIPAGEVRDPQKSLPRALLIAILVVATLYIMIQVVCVGTLPGLAQSQKPLADAGSQFLGAAGGAIISAGAIISIVGNLNILLLSGSRLTYAMSEQKQLPAFVGTIHRQFFTPWVSILITAGLMLFLTLKSSFVAALTISAIARLVTYGATCLALPMFRARREVPKAMFRLPGGVIIAILSLLLIVWLLLNAPVNEVRATAYATAAGLLIYLAYWLYKKRVNHR